MPRRFGFDRTWMMLTACTFTSKRSFAAYLNHVFEAREGARGATGSHGGGCGCN